MVSSACKSAILGRDCARAYLLDNRPMASPNNFIRRVHVHLKGAPEGEGRRAADLAHGAARARDRAMAEELLLERGVRGVLVDPTVARPKLVSTLAAVRKCLAVNRVPATWQHMV